MVAPLMTCSARLPVYALIIAAFIPNRPVGAFNLQGLVLFTLYVAGIVAAMLVAYALKRTALRASYHPLLLRTARIQVAEPEKPDARTVGTPEDIPAAGRHDHSRADDCAVFLSSFSGAADRVDGPGDPIQLRGHDRSLAGARVRADRIQLADLPRPRPGLAAREVAVGALGTVYSLSNTGDDVAATLRADDREILEFSPRRCRCSRGTVFAPQCLSTLVVVKRETNSWRYPLIMAGYLFRAAYLAAFATFRVASALTT